MITDSELERLLTASSPYSREPREGMSLRAQTDLRRMMNGASVEPTRSPHGPRVRAWAASAIAIVAVAIVVVAVPVLAGLGRTAPPVTAGVPTPDAATSEADALGTFVSLDGATTGRVEVHADEESITVKIVSLVTDHDELTASGSITALEDRTCLDDGTDVTFGSFRTADQRYTWLVEGNSMPADWTALHEIDLAVTAPAGEPAECVSTIVARAVLEWTTTAAPRATEPTAAGDITPDQ